MADLASTDVTCSVQKMYRVPKLKCNIVQVVFGNGTLTYPSGGVPLPAASKFGFTNYIATLSIYDQDDASGIVWKYDSVNKKLRGYIAGVIVSAAGSATMDDFALDTTTEPLATAVSVSLTNSTGAGTKYLGKLIELSAGAHAPASQTLYVEATGV